MKILTFFVFVVPKKIMQTIELDAIAEFVIFLHCSSNIFNVCSILRRLQKKNSRQIYSEKYSENLMLKNGRPSNASINRTVSKEPIPSLVSFKFKLIESLKGDCKQY